MSDAFLPVNIGFGIPYALPLIVELLISDKNSLLLIENPESHSDHVINGVKVAIKKGYISNQKVGICFF